MAAAPYFLNPFAVLGTTTTVPSEGSNIGAVNYQYGFTPDYEKDLLADPDALPIPRPQFNQLMLDITTALQRLQLYGAPLWVAPATGSPPVGGPANYPLFARVGYDPGAPYGYQIWESQIAANTSVPGADANWAVVSGGRAIRTGSVISSASPNGYPGAFPCEGAAVSRTTYANLYESITQVQNCVTVSGSDEITVSNFYVLGRGTQAKVEGVGIPAGAYIIAIINPTTVQLNVPATASGSVALRFFFYGNGDGSTTFNLPNYSGKVAVGTNGEFSSVLGNKLGETGGSRTYTQKLSDLVNHTHGGLFTRSPGQSTSGPGLFSAFVDTPSITEGVTGAGAQTAMDIIQESIIEFKYIKF